MSLANTCFLFLNEIIFGNFFLTCIFLYLCVALHQAEKCWWIEDEHESGLYWWWTAGRGYHRWKAALPTQQVGGYANKMACLVHMESLKQASCVSWALRKLESHPSRCAAPATKSHPPTSPNTAPATQNECHQ